jgi:hypothetical protein
VNADARVGERRRAEASAHTKRFANAIDHPAPVLIVRRAMRCERDAMVMSPMECARSQAHEQSTAGSDICEPARRPART